MGNAVRKGNFRRLILNIKSRGPYGRDALAELGIAPRQRSEGILFFRLHDLFTNYPEINR